MAQSSPVLFPAISSPAPNCAASHCVHQALDWQHCSRCHCLQSILLEGCRCQALLQQPSFTLGAMSFHTASKISPRGYCNLSAAICKQAFGDKVLVPSEGPVGQI